MNTVTHYTLFTEPADFAAGLRNASDASRYFAWFMSQIPVRLRDLQLALQKGGSIATELDFSPTSLSVVGNYLDEQISVVRKTPEEASREGEHFPQWVQSSIPDWTLSQIALSVAMDAGIYFGEVMRGQYACLSWDYVRKPKRDADLYLPVLRPFFGHGHLNPLRIAVNAAFGATRGKSARERLPELYEFWSGYVDP